MIKLVFRTFRYLTAYLTGVLNARADPRVQVEQAIEEGKRQHAAISGQAAAVLGNQRELQIKIGRAFEESERLKASATEALRLAERARADGDEPRAAGYEESARIFATQLVTTETIADDLKDLYDKGTYASAAARKAVEQNALRLQQQLAERTRLLTQLEAAKMQERISDALRGVSALAPASDVPTLDEIRDKIERRMALASGRMEIASTSVDGRLVEVQRSAIDARAALRLEELRRAEPTRPGDKP